jgi:hypothetical protein
MVTNTAMWLSILNRYREAEGAFRECCERSAALREVDAQIIPSSRRRVEESRELLAKIDTMLGPRPTARVETSNVPANALSNAAERVFDRWSDRQASPVPRSRSMH